MYVIPHSLMINAHNLKKSKLKLISYQSMSYAHAMIYAHTMSYAHTMRYDISSMTFIMTPSLFISDDIVSLHIMHKEHLAQTLHLMQ